MSAPAAPPGSTRSFDHSWKPLVPPLENGDLLSRAEFERRYEAMPPWTRAELIEGVVHMPPAALRYVQHGGPHFDLNTWLGLYKWQTFGVLGGITASVRIDQSNEPQPDLVLFIAPGLGGQAWLDADGYVAGVPEMALEIAASSVSIDLGAKFKSYCRHGVQEYLVWRVLDEAIDWFRLRGDRYEQLIPDDHGVLKSEVFPGLWLDPVAMIRGNVARIQVVLQQGIADPSHAAFVAKLRATK